MTALSGEELVEWIERTAAGWRKLIFEHPEILSMPCDVRRTTSVAELLQHIVAVELRYAERLNNLPESEYDSVSLRSSEELYQSHDRAMGLVRPLLVDTAYPWEESMQFQTLSAGVLSAKRRTILVHLVMHSIRHYAQLATLVRQHGVKPDWPMDYLFMQARPA